MDTIDLCSRLNRMATAVEHWRSEAKLLSEAARRPEAATDDELLFSVEETSGAIYREIDVFDELVKDVDTKSQVAAGQIAEVGDALRLLLMEITELGTGLYSLRSSDMSKAGDVHRDLVEFATSSNGDKWLLGPAEGNHPAFVEHRANEPSGGSITRTSVAEFLDGKPAGPQHDALRQLLEDVPASAKRDAQPDSDGPGPS